jgi:hypothetical protein
MKKRIALLGTTVLALALVAAMSFAWFTSGTDPIETDVTTAKIELVQSGTPEWLYADDDSDVSYLLAGETVKLTGVTVTNNSNREALAKVEIVIGLTGLEDETWYAAFQEDATKEANENAYDALLLKWGAGAPVYLTANKELYVFLENPADPLFSGSPDISLDGLSFTLPEDVDNGIQDTNITIDININALQGTQAAVADVFGSAIETHFHSLLSNH